MTLHSFELQGRHFTLHRAALTDTDDVLALLQGAARWLQSRGINQWGHYLDDEERPELAAQIGRGEVL